MTEQRIAVIAIIVRNRDSAEGINALLHDHAPYIIGRMGLPHRTGGLSLISVAVEAPQNIINTLAGRIGRLPGVEAKTVYAPADTNAETAS